MLRTEQPTSLRIRDVTVTVFLDQTLHICSFLLLQLVIHSSVSCWQRFVCTPARLWDKTWQTQLRYCSAVTFYFPRLMRSLQTFLASRQQQILKKLTTQEVTQFGGLLFATCCFCTTHFPPCVCVIALRGNTLPEWRSLTLHYCWQLPPAFCINAAVSTSFFINTNEQKQNKAVTAVLHRVQPNFLVRNLSSRDSEGKEGYRFDEPWAVQGQTGT